MAGVTFSEGEVKRLILALAGSKDMSVEEPEEESPKHEADPKDEGEDAAEGKSHGEGKPFGKSEDKEESTKDMLARKLKEKGSK